MGEKKCRGLMSSGAKKEGPGASTPCCVAEKPATRQKEFVVNNNSTQFPFDWHNSFQHNEELGPVPISV